MQILRHLLALAVVVVIAAAVSAADDAKKAKKKAKTARGTVVSVEKEDGKNAGTVTVKVTTGPKGNKTTEEKKFTITEATKVQTIVGKPKDKNYKDGSFADIAKDKLVILTLKGDAVEDVKVGAAKKNK